VSAIAVAAGVWLMSSLTLTTGIGGGAAYIPMLVVLVGLDVATAIGTGIVIQLAGVTTTAAGHLVAGRTDLALALRLATAALAGLVVTRLALYPVAAAAIEPGVSIALIAVAVWIAFGRPQPEPVLPATPWSCRQLGPTLRAGPPLSVLPAQARLRPGGRGRTRHVAAGDERRGDPDLGAHAALSGPPRIAVGTGTAAAVVTLAAAVVLITVQGRVAWPLVAVSAPAAALGARASRVVATHLPQEAMRRGIGVIMLCSAVELGIRRVLL
jgi:uncharacterized membrane protein YfcA